MFDFSARALSTFLLVSVMWIFGGIELFHVLGDLPHQWYWLVIAFFYSITINELFCHLVIGHHYFPIDTKSIGFKVFMFLEIVDHGFGPPAAYAQLHVLHHEYPDIPGKDPLIPKNNWFSTNIASPLMYLYQAPMEIPDQSFFDEQWKKNEELINDPWSIFCVTYAVPLTLLFWLCLYLLLPIVLFKVIFLGRVLLSIAHALASIGTHRRLLIGVQNIKGHDQTYNNHLLNLITLTMFPSMLHNNHHNGFTTNSHSTRWYEIDLGSVVINYVIKPLMIKR